MWGTSSWSSTEYALARRSPSLGRLPGISSAWSGLGENCFLGGTSRFSMTVIWRHSLVCWNVLVSPSF